MKKDFQNIVPLKIEESITNLSSTFFSSLHQKLHITEESRLTIAHKGLNLKNPTSKTFQPSFELCFFTEPNTRLFNTNFEESFCHISLIGSSKIQNNHSNFWTDECVLLIEENNRTMNAIANNFLSKIEELETQGKKHSSIKEAHKLFEKLLSIPSIEIADQVLKQAANKKFSLAILIAFLASTLSFKNELSNRILLFEKAKRLAIADLGVEKANSPIFDNLK